MKRTTFLKSLAGLAVLPLMSFKDIFEENTKGPFRVWGNKYCTRGTFKSKEDEAIEALNQIELVGLKPYWRTNERQNFEIKYPSGYRMTWSISEIDGNWFGGGNGTIITENCLPHRRPMISWNFSVHLMKDGKSYDRVWPRAITVLPPVFKREDANFIHIFTAPN